MPPAEPIAVVGIGCRFPGAVHDLNSFWKLLVEGREAWSEVPAARFNGDAFHHPARSAPASHGHRGGHFLDQNIAAFDAAFFGISATEAAAVDPQQRLLLEVAYEALENAGISTERVRGSNTSVHVATFMHDYENMMYRDGLVFPQYSMTGTGTSIASNRLSYVFDLRGPSITLDAGCSGGLVALHQACQSLRVAESTMALAGGTNLILSPDTMMPMDLLHLLNPQGQCFPFDQRGSGYGRGEGVAVLVLKRLSDALQAHDSIHAVIRGSGVNQDGKTAGITMPSPVAQRDLIRATYQSAGLDPMETALIEAHGTGTIKGDVAELQALSEIFATGRDGEGSPYVGSVKANIGHTEAASGLAGFIKAVLILQKGVIPPNPKLRTLKDSLQQFSGRLKIQHESVTWPMDCIRRASINSFGYGGTNAHVIVEHPGLLQSKLITSVDSQSHLNSNGFESQRKIMCLSANTTASLQSYAFALSRWLDTQSDVDISNFAYTLNRRSKMRHRYAFQAETRAEIMSALDAETVKPIRSSPQRSMIFVFSGQGTLWYATARELLERSVVFRHSIATSDVVLRDMGVSWNIQEELHRDELSSRIHESQFAQPITTAIQIGIVDVLRHLSVVPNHVIAHSSGEIAAAYTTGALSHEAAIKIAYHRGSLSEIAADKLSCKGAMITIGLSESDLAPYLARIRRGNVTVACMNSPSNTTVAGDASAIAELQHMLRSKPIFCHKLNVDTAYHSEHMQAVAEEYSARIEAITTGATATSARFYSTVTADLKTTEFGPGYWVSNLVSKVRFQETLQNLCKHLSDRHDASRNTYHAFVEIGSHPVLSLPIKQTISILALENFQFGCAATLVRGKDAELTLLKTVGSICEWGFDVDLSGASQLSGRDGHRVISDLPTYAWDHSGEFWWESRVSRQHRFRSRPYHELVGVRSPSDHHLNPTWRHLVSIESLPWIQDHQVHGRLIFPGAGYLTMAIEAKLEMTRERHGNVRIEEIVLHDVVFEETLELQNSDTVEITMSLSAPVGKRDKSPDMNEEFRIFSITQGGDVAQHCSGRIKVLLAGSAPADIATSSPTPDTLSYSVDPKTLYADLEDIGHRWGRTFALVNKVSIGPHHAQGTVQIPDVARYMPGRVHQPYLIHPTTLDALIHSTLMIYARTCAQRTMLPVAVGELRISAAMASLPVSELLFDSSIVPQEGVATFGVAAYSISRENVVLVIKDGQLRGTSESESATHRSTPLPAYLLTYGCDPELDDHYSLRENNEVEQDVSKWASERIRLLDQAALHYAQECLKKIDLRHTDAKHREYVRWLQDLPQPDMATEQMFPDIADESRFNELGAERQAVCQIGQALPQILTGESEALGILLKDDLLARLYSEDPSAVRCSKRLSTYLRHLSFKHPKLRVIEVGAGTGGATLPILQALTQGDRSLLERYDFTDISRGFFEAAQEKLKTWEGVMQFKPFDLGADPERQGFELHSYDLCIAYNALHATASIDQAIKHAQQLLKPGGKLIIIEITKLPLYTNAIFGLMPGWYLDRVDGREGAPTMSIDEWKSRLTDKYFSQIDYVDDFEGPGHQMSLIIATASSTEPRQHLKVVTVGPSKLSAALKHSVICDNRFEFETLDVQSLEAHRAGKDSIYLICSPIKDATFEAFLGAVQSANARIILIECSNDSVMEGNFPLKRHGVRDAIRVAIDDNESHLDWDVVARAVIRIISYHTTNVASPKDNTYILCDGKLQVPRLILCNACPAFTEQDMGPSNIDPDALSKSERLIHETRPLQEIGTYVVIGDHQGLGIDLSAFLLNRGVRHLVLLSTGHVEATYQTQFGLYFENLGVKACISPLEEQGSDPLESFRNMPQPYGFFAVNEIAGVKAGEIQQFENDTHILQNCTDFLERVALFPGISRHLVRQISGFVDSIGFAIIINTTGSTALPLASRLPNTNVVKRRDIPTVTVILPSLKDICLVHQDTRSLADLQKAGFFPVRKPQFYSLLEKALTEVCDTNGWRNIIMGIDTDDMDRPNSPEKRTMSILSQVPQITVADQNSPGIDHPPQLSEMKIEEARSITEASRIVIRDLRRKISSFIAIEEDMIDFSTSIEDFGLDSLVTFNLRGWIHKTFKSTVKVNEITEAANIPALVALILSRTSHRGRLHQEELPESKDDHVSVSSPSVGLIVETATDVSTTPASELSPSAGELFRQPLPELSATLESLLEGIASICSRTELEQTKLAASAMQRPGSFGLVLQERLTKRFHDPTITNWLTDLYTPNRFLRARAGIVPFQTYFGTHPDGLNGHSQAERAAIVSLAAFRFKKHQESGQLEPQYLSGRLIDPHSSHFLFHSHRCPGHVCDELVKHPPSNVIGVLFRGHAYMVDLHLGGSALSLQDLTHVFENILTSNPSTVVSPGSLTAGDRTRWAETRDALLNTSLANSYTIRSIEKSAFIVCLDDDAAPTDAEQRFHQFLGRADTNRWYDKTLQFVVCSNGTSASVLEHAALDGVAVEPLHAMLHQAIRDHQPRSHADQRPWKDSGYTWLPLELSVSTTELITTFCSSFQAAAAQHTFRALNDRSLGSNMIDSHRWPVQSTIQLAIQLASRIFFGYSPFSMETVSMAHYRQGRVDINPLLRPAMSRFLDMAVAPAASERLHMRALAYDAAREHAKYLTRARNGRAFGRHLVALEWVQEPGEPQPALFSDPGYVRSKAAKVLTSSFTTGWQEGGFTYPVPDGILVYFEVHHIGVTYSIFGNAVSADHFGHCLVRASEQVRSLLDGAPAG